MRLALQKYLTELITPEIVDLELTNLHAEKTDIDAITVYANANIGDYAFANFTALTSVTNGSLINSIGKHSFENCSALPSFTFKNELAIPAYAFSGCSNLTKFQCAKALGIGECAFKNSGITYIKNTIYGTIGKNAFLNCDGLTSVDIRYSTECNDYTFSNCVNIKNVTLPPNYKIANGMFNNCQTLSSIMNLKSITNVGDYAFASCFNLLDTIKLDTCTEIGRYAFLSCQNLSNLNAPQCTFVDYNAFYGTKLWDVDPQQ